MYVVECLNGWVRFGVFEWLGPNGWVRFCRVLEKMAARAPWGAPARRHFFQIWLAGWLAAGWPITYLATPIHFGGILWVCQPPVFLAVELVDGVRDRLPGPFKGEI